MENIKKFLSDNRYPFVVRNDNKICLCYKSESIYGSKGFLLLSFSDGKFLVEDIAPSCRRSVVCSYGQQYVSVHGYGIGTYDTITEETAIEKLSKTIKRYEII